MKSFVFLADGFEELEALSPVDVMRRAGMDVTTVSISSSLEVTGAHGVVVKSDKLFADVDFDGAEWIVCPGGLGGAQNLAAFEPLAKMLKSRVEANQKVAAICASPALVFAPLGIIKGRKATCYPGMESYCAGSEMIDTFVVKDGCVITGQGPAAAIEFALAIVAESLGAEKAAEVAAGMLYDRK